MSNGNLALVKVKEAGTYLEKKQQQITKWVRGGVQAEALIRFALQEMQTTPKLRECTPQSVYLALLACAVTGLEPGALKQEAFLVPFGRNLGTENKPQWIQEAKFMAGWRGLQKQAIRAGGVKMIQSAVVYEEDFIDMDLGTANTLIYKPSFASDRGRARGAFSWAQLTNGFRQIIWVPVDELDKIRAFAEKRAPSPPWRMWTDEMRCKSALRRLAKHLPMDETYFRGVQIEAHSDGVDDSPTDVEVIDMLTDGDAFRETAEELASAAAFQGPPQPEVVRAIGNKPRPKPIEANATERPTQSASTSSTSQAGSSSPSPSAPASTSSASASTATAPTPTSSSSGNPTSPTPAATAATLANHPASGPSPAASSPAPSATTPTSTASEAAPTASASSAPATEDQWESFGEDPRDVVVAADQGERNNPKWWMAQPRSLEAFAGWLRACTTKTILRQEKGVWIDWCKTVAKLDAAGLKKVGDDYSRRSMELPE